MRSSIFTTVTFVLLLLLTSTPAAAQKQKRPPVASPGTDIEVTLYLANGTKLTYDSEVRQLQILLDVAGRIDTIHLILAKGSSDTNTHEWFSFRNLAGFSYRYLLLTGRARVQVLRLQEVPGEVDRIENPVPLVRPENYQ
jgi:hypothetical protein